MNAILNSIAVWLADFFLLTSVLLATSLALRVVVRSAAARVTLAWGTWLGIVAIAVFTALPSWPRVAIEEMAAKFTRPPIAEIRSQPEANLSPVKLPTDVVLAAAPLETTIVVREPLKAIASQEPIARVEWTAVVSAMWLTSVLVGLAWILLGHCRTCRLLTTAKAAPAWVGKELESLVQGVKQKGKERASKLPGLWSSERIATAVAMVARAPQIVLPRASVVESNRTAIRAALAHEWAHIRHGDLWLLALERALLPLLAMHPLFWWLRRSVRLDQELLADAAAAGEEPVAYAEALLAWARSADAKQTSLARHGLAAVGLWEHPSTLSRRVAMLVDSKRSPAQPLGPGWTAILSIAIAALVLSLSVVSLRPLTAQEESAPPADITADPELAPAKIVRENREAPRAIPKGPTTIPITQIHMNLIVMSVDRAKLDAADTSLEDEIAAATESRCRKEAGLVVSEIKTAEVTALVEALKKHNALNVESRPSIVTIDGREAHFHAGGEAPILRVEETINGKHEQRVEYKEFGTLLMVRPKLDANKKEEFVTLDIVAEQSTLLPPGQKAEEGAVPRDVPGLVSHKFKLTADAKLGGSLLVAEATPNKKQLREGVKKQFLLIVTPEQAVRSEVGVYADPREADKAESAKKDAEAALNAATAAEPEPGTGAAALLARERELRAKETADLRKQIEALTSDVQSLRAAAGPTITLAFSPKHKRPSVVQGELNEVLLAIAPQDRLHVKVESGMNQLYVQCSSDLAAAIGKVLGILDRPLGFVDDPAGTSRTILKEAIERRMRTKTAKPSVELKDDVQYFPPGPEEMEPRWTTQTYRLKKGDAAKHKAGFLERYSKSPISEFKVIVEFSEDTAKVSAPADLMDEVKKLLEPLGAEEIVRTAPTANPAAAPKVTKVFRLRHTEAIPVIQKIGQMMKKEVAGDVTLVPDGDSNAVIVSAPEPYFAEIEQVIQMLDKPVADPARSADKQLLELDVAQAKLEVERAEHDFARVQQLAANKAISQTEVDAARFALAAAQIQLRKAEAKLQAGGIAAPTTATETAEVSAKTEVALLELDLAEAKLRLQVVEAELAMTQEVNRKNPGAVSEPELRKVQFEAERAKIQVQRMMVKLEAAKEPDEVRRR